MKSLIPENPIWRIIAGEWHDGQFSMLYAVSSTGDLTPGSVTYPYRCETEHLYELWSSLDSELDTVEREFLVEDSCNYSYEDVCEFHEHVAKMAEYLDGELEKIRSKKKCCDCLIIDGKERHENNCLRKFNFMHNKKYYCFDYETGLLYLQSPSVQLAWLKFEVDQYVIVDKYEILDDSLGILSKINQ